VPITGLLSKPYAAERRALIGTQVSPNIVPAIRSGSIRT
jgi:hypothetical protein